MTKKILVAEDEKPLAKALELKLTHSGFEVEITGDGQATLNALGKGKYDLILLDIMMPGVDGFEVLKQMGDKKKKIPIIVSSNLSQPEDIERAKTLGASDYFVKSEISLADIVKKIEKIL